MLKCVLGALILCAPAAAQLHAPSFNVGTPACTSSWGDVEPQFERSTRLMALLKSPIEVPPPESKDQPASVTDPTEYGRQTKRILYIFPNFRAISAGAHLPPQTAKDKLLDATLDTFDYSNWVFIGILSGIGQAKNSTPEFRQGGVGYGRYYWHGFVDQADENYFVEGLMPIVLRQDSRYYTLGQGRFLRRAFYAFSRGVLTRSDLGKTEPNYSEIVGAGASAGISNLYYPNEERTWTKTGQRWATSVGLDIMTNAFKEFWPDINRKIFHQK